MKTQCFLFLLLQTPAYLQLKDWQISAADSVLTCAVFGYTQDRYDLHVPRTNLGTYQKGVLYSAGVHRFSKKLGDTSKFWVKLNSKLRTHSFEVWPVSFTVIWYFLLSADEVIQNFVCKKRNCNNYTDINCNNYTDTNCNNYTDTNATVQNVLARDLCTPVVLHLFYSVIIHHHKKFKSLYKHVDICLKTVPIF